MNDAYFASAFEHAAIGMALVGPDGRWLKVNRAICEMIGYTEAELMGSTFQDITHPEDLAADLENVKRILGGEIASYQMEKRYFHKQGRTVWVWLTVSLIRDAAGEPMHFIAQIEDITQRRQVEEALRASEERYRMLFARNPLPMWVYDAQTFRFLAVNAAAVQHYGYSEGELLSMSVLDIRPEEEVPVVQAMIESLRREGGRNTGLWRHRKKNGEVIHVEVTTDATVFDGRQARLVLAHDVTLRRRAEDERKKMEAQFLRSQRMESIGTLAGGIAHDLNNVLAPIIMSIDLLKLRITDPAGRDTLALIASSARRGAEMVSQVLYFARGIEGERITVDTAVLLRDLERFVTDTFPKNIVFRVEADPQAWTITGDATQLYQVMLNLCVNARDAMPHGGRLTVSMENAVLDEVDAERLVGTKAGCYVVFQIEDTGSGIPREILDKIFDPFFTTKDVGKGTGLGLSTSLAIVKSHGGFLQVYSEPSAGTRFRVHLPAEEEGIRQEAAPAPHELPEGTGQTVLLVDDETSIRQVTGQTLESFGYRVLTAVNGADALRVFEQHRDEIAVVLTDMMMPVMDGPALIQALSALAPRLKIIAASGIGTHARAAGPGVRFVQKPYTAETLLKMLSEVLDQVEE